jgi:hypothetical protein
MHRILTIDPIY